MAMATTSSSSSSSTPSSSSSFSTGTIDFFLAYADTQRKKKDCPIDSDDEDYWDQDFSSVLETSNQTLDFKWKIKPGSDNHDTTEKWIFTVTGFASLPGKTETVGYARAFYIRRSVLCDFLEMMDEPSDAMSKMAMTLFDDDGCLLPQHYSQVFSEDCDLGELLVLDEIVVDSEHRRRGIGTALTQELVRVCSAADIAVAHMIGLSHTDGPLGEESPSCQWRKVQQLGLSTAETEEVAYKLMRRCGFRRVGKTKYGICVINDAQHPCWDRSAKDLKPPAEPKNPELKEEDQKRIEYLMSVPDNQVKHVLQKYSAVELTRLNALQHFAGANKPTHLKITLEMDGIDANSTDVNGNTALHIAACLGSEPTAIKQACNIACLLRCKGANPKLKNNYGLTPLDSFTERKAELKQFAKMFGSLMNQHFSKPNPMERTFVKLLN